MPGKKKGVKELSSIRKMSCKELFWECWRGDYEKRKEEYAGSELFKQHMKGVIDETKLFKDRE